MRKFEVDLVAKTNSIRILDSYSEIINKLSTINNLGDFSFLSVKKISDYPKKGKEVDFKKLHKSISNNIKSELNIKNKDIYINYHIEYIEGQYYYFYVSNLKDNAVKKLFDNKIEDNYHLLNGILSLVLKIFIFNTLNIQEKTNFLNGDIYMNYQIRGKDYIIEEGKKVIFDTLKLNTYMSSKRDFSFVLSVKSYKGEIKENHVNHMGGQYILLDEKNNK